MYLPSMNASLQAPAATTVRISITDAEGAVFAIHTFDNPEHVAALAALLDEARNNTAATEYDGTAGDNAARILLDDMCAACEAE